MRRAADVKYCFVFGCPRSGTTELVRLLQAHPRIVIGMERYKLLLSRVRDRAAFGPELFEPERFFDFRSGDTNVNPDLGHFKGHYVKTRRRFEHGRVVYVGDKVMPDEPIIRVIEARFPSPKFVFIYRDLLHVASSFAARARNPEDRNWPSTEDHKAAIKRWHAAFSTADALIDRIGLESVCVLRYDDLLNGDIRACELMFRFLGLRVAQSVRRTYEARTADWDKRQSKPLALSPDEVNFVSRRIQGDLVDRFDLRFQEQLARYVRDQ
jgi:Sulfotransferase family